MAFPGFLSLDNYHFSFFTYFVTFNAFYSHEQMTSIILVVHDNLNAVCRCVLGDLYSNCLYGTDTLRSCDYNEIDL